MEYIHCSLYDCGDSSLGSYCAIQTIRYPQAFYAYSHEALNGYFCIIPYFIGLCEGWYRRFPWLSCDCSFILQRYYITASLRLISFNFQQQTLEPHVFVQASRSVACCTVNISHWHHMDNIENQYIICICTNYCCINISSDIGPPTVLYRYRLGKKCHIDGRYFG